MSEIHELATSYALNALEPDERVGFEAHLAGCPTCQAEVAAVTTTLGDLSALDAATPSTRLRTNILAAVHGTRSSAAAAPTAAGRPPTQVTDRNRRRDESRRAVRDSQARRAAGEPAGSAQAAVEELALRRQRRRTRILTGLVAALVALAVGLGAVVLELTRERQAQVAQTTLEQQLYAAPDTVATTTALADGGQITLVASKQLNRALFLGTSLPDPGSDRYQLWTATGPDPQTLTRAVPDRQVAETGPGVKVFFTGDIAAADYLAVNLEPAGSTPQTPVGSLLAVGPTSG